MKCSSFCILMRPRLTAMGGGLPSGEGGLDPFRFAFCYIFISLYFASFFGGLKTICCCRCCQLQGRGNRGTLSQHPPFLCAPFFWLEHICTVWQFLSNFSMTWVGHFPPFPWPPAWKCCILFKCFPFPRHLFTARRKKGKIKSEEAEGAVQVASLKLKINFTVNTHKKRRWHWPLYWGGIVGRKDGD